MTDKLLNGAVHEVRSISGRTFPRQQVQHARSYATVTRLRDDTMDRIQQAFEKVQERLRRAAAVLEQTGLGDAVIGGNAVIHGISQANPAAYRFTQDVDILIRRDDLPIMIQAMESAGFRFRHVRGLDVFLDGPQSKVQDAVHLLFACEKVRSTDLASTAAVEESIPGNGYRVLALEALVRMKLTSYRLKDQAHLDDLLRAGLIDASCLDYLSPQLAERFQKILDQFEPDLTCPTLTKCPEPNHIVAERLFFIHAGHQAQSGRAIWTHPGLRKSWCCGGY